MKVSYRQIWWLAFLVMAAPLAGLVVIALTGGLGANPIEYVNRYLGDWALRALLVALAATPLKRLTGWAWPVRLRRMLGLWAFAYVTLHLTNYTAVDQFFDFTAIGADIVKRKFITAGMAAYVIVLALAATSPKAMVRKLGGKAWQRLHKLVYLGGALACLHYFWMVKADILMPSLHAGVLAVLLGVRAIHWVGRHWVGRHWVGRHWVGRHWVGRHKVGRGLPAQGTKPGAKPGGPARPGSAAAR